MEDEIENYFATEDFSLAVFLSFNKVDLFEVKKIDVDLNRCVFIFRIPQDSMDLTNMKREWATSPRCAEFKQILMVSKRLKNELKIVLSAK